MGFSFHPVKLHNFSMNLVDQANRSNRCFPIKMAAQSGANTLAVVTGIGLTTFQTADFFMSIPGAAIKYPLRAIRYISGDQRPNRPYHKLPEIRDCFSKALNVIKQSLGVVTSLFGVIVVGSHFNARKQRELGNCGKYASEDKLAMDWYINKAVNSAQDIHKRVDRILVLEEFEQQQRGCEKTKIERLGKKQVKSNPKEQDPAKVKLKEIEDVRLVRNPIVEDLDYPRDENNRPLGKPLGKSEDQLNDQEKHKLNEFWISKGKIVANRISNQSYSFYNKDSERINLGMESEVKYFHWREQIKHELSIEKLMRKAEQASILGSRTEMAQVLFKACIKLDPENFSNQKNEERQIEGRQILEGEGVSDSEVEEDSEERVDGDAELVEVDAEEVEVDAEEVEVDAEEVEVDAEEVEVDAEEVEVDAEEVEVDAEEVEVDAEEVEVDAEEVEVDAGQVEVIEDQNEPEDSDKKELSYTVRLWNAMPSFSFLNKIWGDKGTENVEKKSDREDELYPL